MPAPIVIRRGSSADVAALQAIERDAARLYATIPDYRFVADAPVRSDEEHARVLQDGVALVAEVEGTVAGFLLLLPLDDRAHVLELAVSPRFFRQGIGRRLLSDAFDLARADGHGTITLTTFTEPPWTGPFYRSIGFTIFEPEDHAVELKAIIAEERESGFHIRPRVAMRRQL